MSLPSKCLPSPQWQDDHENELTLVDLKFRGRMSGLDGGVAYTDSVRAWMAVVEGVSAAWSARTPCAEWDVHQLVNHVVGEDRWTRPLVDGMTIADVGNSLDGDLLGDDPFAAARTAADEAVAAVDSRLPAGGMVHL